MKANEQAEARQLLIRQTLSATTILEVEAAWQALKDWMQIHPEDEGMRAGFEQLAQMREIAEIEVKAMANLQLSNEEIARRAEELYERDIRAKVEDKYDGKIIMIDIESGDYEIDDNTLPAADRLRARHSDATFYAMRIGYDAVYALGGTLTRAKQ